MSMIPERKNANKAGKNGTAIKVFTNMISIIFKNNFNVKATHYDVKFDPEKPVCLRKYAFEAMRKQHFPKNWPAFDGRANAISAGDLPCGTHVCKDIFFF